MTGETQPETSTQQAINDAEWNDPANWSHPKVGVYFSKRDSRIWVPKRLPSWGWTLNMGHPDSMMWLVGIILLPMLVVAAVLGRKHH